MDSLYLSGGAVRRRRCSTGSRRCGRICLTRKRVCHKRRPAAKTRLVLVRVPVPRRRVVRRRRLY
jgi:hypothetical protein